MLEVRSEIIEFSSTPTAPWMLQLETLQSLRGALHELLTGRRPFDGDTPLETMDRVREAQLGPLEEVEADVRPLLRACLARKPEERVGTAEAFRALLGPLRRARPEAGPFELARWVRGSESSTAQAHRPAETVLEEGEAEES